MVHSREHCRERSPGRNQGNVEALRVRRDVCGGPSHWNHHDRQLRAGASVLGLIVSAHGVNEDAPGSPVIDLAGKHGPNTPERPAVAVSSRPDRSGTFQLKKWPCECTSPVNVRVATADFGARRL